MRNHPHTIHRSLLAVAVVGALAFAGNANAAGFQLKENSVRSMGSAPRMGDRLPRLTPCARIRSMEFVPKAEPGTAITPPGSSAFRWVSAVTRAGMCRNRNSRSC